MPDARHSFAQIFFYFTLTFGTFLATFRRSFFYLLKKKKQ